MVRDSAAGAERHVEVTVARTAAWATVQLVVVSFRHVTDQVTASRQQALSVEALHALARTDVLTGRPNRRAWEGELERLMLATTATPLVVALLDFDRFKDFNDSRGHDAGDDHLRQSADLWRAQLPNGAVLARLGGEEFALALPGRGLSDAHALVDQMCRGLPHGQTASAGLTCHAPGETARALMHRADAALYVAKRNSRRHAKVLLPTGS